MTVQLAGPVPDAGEFHQIHARLVSDVTVSRCESCGDLEHTGSGMEGHTAHGADHAMATGHTVTVEHVRRVVFAARQIKEQG